MTNRAQSAIKTALLELLLEKNYSDIKISDITQRADVGRSTLYKQYQSKADVLMDIHVDMFTHIIGDLFTSIASHVEEPPPKLVDFLERSRSMRRNPLAISYKLGRDLDYLINTIPTRLALIVEEKFKETFKVKGGDIPIQILSQSISHLLIGLIMSWFTKFQSFHARQYAVTIQRLMKSMIFESLEG